MKSKYTKGDYINLLIGWFLIVLGIMLQKEGVILIAGGLFTGGLTKIIFD